jgi:hypothetical protein
MHLSMAASCVGRDVLNLYMMKEKEFPNRFFGIMEN